MLKIYNSLTRKKEEFRPPKRGKVGIYACGPTVYDEPHIGHARSAYIFDVIVRYLRFRFSENKIIFVRNVTDIDDKIIDRARREPGSGELNGKVKLIAEKYLARYHEDMDALGLDKPDIEPKATETIKDMIVFIKTLIRREYAYESSGNVYFDVRKFKEYGSLSGQSLERMLEGARVAVDKQKKDPLDFALWKASEKDEPYWKSPWSNGRPGWHIECSVMSTKYLKKDFLIHGGGLDLIFPHHENEIAQTVCAGRKSADYWIHNGLLTINGQKMSKSLGNFVSIKAILKKYHPEVLKLFFLLGHYRSPIDFTYEKMDNIAQAREAFYKLFNRIDNTISNSRPPIAYDDAELAPRIKKPDEYRKLFIEAMDDDFNMSAASGYFYMIKSNINRMIDDNRWNEKILIESKDLLRTLGEIFGLFKDKDEFNKRKVLRIELAENIKIQDYCNLNVKNQEDKEIVDLIKKREEARINKDYKTADEIRNRLLQQGIIIEDTKDGPACRRKV